MPGHKHIASVRHALDVLELIGNSPEGLSLAQIARGTGIRKQTVYNILGTMKDKGFLEKDLAHARYRLADPMRGLRNQQETWNRLLLLPAVPLAIRAARQLQADVFIIQYVGGGVIARFKAYRDPDVAPTPWYNYPVYAHGTGVLLEAFMSDAERRVFRRGHPFSDADLEYWKSYDLLDGFLELVKREGYVAFFRGGTFRVVAAILDRQGQAVAGVSAVKQYNDMGSGEPAICIEVVRRIANELSAALARGALPKPGQGKPV